MLGIGHEIAFLAFSVESYPCAPFHLSFTNSDTAVFDNPQGTGKGFLGHEIQHSVNGGLYRDMRLIAETQHNDACKLRRWVGKNIGKIQIQGNESTFLSPTNINYSGIRCTSESLLNN